MASTRYCAGASPQPHVQQQLQTINPALLLNRGTNAIHSSETPSQPIQRPNFAQPPPSSTSSPSPYTTNARDAWMGSSGYPMSFTRSSMGNFRPNWGALLRYEPEPLEPLFGLEEHLPPLPSPPPQQQRTPPVPRFRPNVGWVPQQRQPTYFNTNVKVMCNGQERLVPHRAYVMQTRVR